MKIKILQLHTHTRSAHAAKAPDEYEVLLLHSETHSQRPLKSGLCELAEGASSGRRGRARGRGLKRQAEQRFDRNCGRGRDFYAIVVRF